MGKTISIIGLGLIGGSLAKAFRKLEEVDRIIGVDLIEEHRVTAQKIGIVDECAELETACAESDVIVLAMPVDAIENQIWNILGLIDHQVVMDVGSTKNQILKIIERHPKRGRFVACHPMSGTEFSGPLSAKDDLFNEKYNVICDPEESDQDALLTIEKLLRKIGMKLLYQGSEAHDKHVAYVSHISHISAFALALTVLHKEKSEEQIFQLASGGFRSSVRLAKSNPKTWSPIFEQNRDNVLDVLDEHITVLSKFRSLLIKKDFEQFESLMQEANEIKRILNQ